jgi:hypothetical protein
VKLAPPAGGRYYRTGGGRSSVLRRPTVFFLTALAILAAAVLACGDGGASSAKSTPTPRDPSAIRRVDLTKDPSVINTLRQLGSGEVAVREVLYADLTADGEDEAIVPVTSNGTVGNIAYVVLTMQKDAPAVILTRRLERGSAGGLKMTVDTATGRSVLVETAAEYGPEDALCCPSVLRRTTFRWDGSQLQVEREEKTPAPANPKTRGD